jgi:hypothetical protein
MSELTHIVTSDFITYTLKLEVDGISLRRLVFSSNQEEWKIKPMYIPTPPQYPEVVLVSKPIWDLVHKMPLDDIPLYITSDPEIARWRLSIAK